METTIMESSVPVIDLGISVCDDEPKVRNDDDNNQNPNENDEQSIVEKIDQALRDYGFFYVINHGISQALIEEQFEISKQLFDLPLATKQKMPFNPTLDIGYLESGKQAVGLTKQGDGDEMKDDGKIDVKNVESATKENEKTTTQIDTKEQFMMTNNKLITGRHHGNESNDNDDIFAGSENYVIQEIPDHRSVATAYMKAAYNLNLQLQSYLFDALGVDEKQRHDLGEQPFLVLKQMKYAGPISDPAKGIYGAGAHTDWGSFTILATDQQPGLQIYLPRTNKWMNVPPIPGSLIVNAGDQISILTNNYYKSALHRVLTTSEKPRFSTAIFAYFGMDATFQPLLKFRIKGRCADDLSVDRTTREYFHYKLHQSIYGNDAKKMVDKTKQDDKTEDTPNLSSQTSTASSSSSTYSVSSSSPLRRSKRDIHSIKMSGGTCPTFFNRLDTLFFSNSTMDDIGTIFLKGKRCNDITIERVTKINETPIYVIDKFLTETELQYFDNKIKSTKIKFERSFVDNMDYDNNGIEDEEEEEEEKEEERDNSSGGTKKDKEDNITDQKITKRKKRKSRTILDDTHRTSTFYSFRKLHDTTISGIEQRIADIFGCWVHQIEALQLVRYGPDQFFNVHHDMGDLLDDDSVCLPSKNIAVKRRLVTIFCYLNTLDDDQGGTTYFPKCSHLRVQPKRGRAVLWSNVTKYGQPDPRTIHAGEPIKDAGNSKCPETSPCKKRADGDDDSNKVEMTKYGLNIWICEE